MINVTLTGRLVKKPELSELGNGVKVANFSVASDRRRPNAEGERTTDFFDVVAWRAQAEAVAKYLDKGSQETYTAKDGTKRTTYRLVADEIQFLSPPKGEKLEKTSKEEASEQ